VYSSEAGYKYSNSALRGRYSKFKGFVSRFIQHLIPMRIGLKLRFHIRNLVRIFFPRWGGEGKV